MSYYDDHNKKTWAVMRMYAWLFVAMVLVMICYGLAHEDGEYDQHQMNGEAKFRAVQYINSKGE